MLTKGQLRALRTAPATLCLLIGTLTFIGFLLLRFSGAMQPVELTLYDWMLRFDTAPHADPNIVVIGESEKDLQHYGYPLPDQVFADILRKLLDAGVSTVGVDKYRDIPTPLPEGCTTRWDDLMDERCFTNGRRALDEVLRNHPRVIWIRLFGGKDDQIPVYAPPVLYTFERGAEQIGLNDSITDPDGVLRRGFLYLDSPPTCANHDLSIEDCPAEQQVGGDFGYSLGLMLAMAHTGVPVRFDQDGTAILGETPLPPLEANDGGYQGVDAAGYQFLLDFPGRPHPFATYSIADLLEDRIPPTALAGRIALVGAMTRSIKDEVELPFRPLNSNYPFFNGVFLHGFITSQLVAYIEGRRQPPGFASEWQETLFLAIWSLLGSLLGLWIRSMVRFLLLALTGTALILGFGYGLFLFAGYWIAFGAATLAWITSAVLSTAYISGSERQQRQQLMGMFSQHVSRDVAEMLWQDREAFMEGGRPKPNRQTATVLFTDIVGFTAISEQMPPDEVMDWLNDYLGRMGQTVLDNGGIINKYVGDAIMGVFGAPKPRLREEEITRDARNAVQCALDMVGVLEELNEINRSNDRPSIAIRVGIHTGPLVAGSLGSSERMEYTVIGDTVNTASRLESLKGGGSNARFFDGDCRIMIGETTFDRLGEAYQARYIGSISVQGKEKPLKLYQVPSNQPHRGQHEGKESTEP